MTGASQGIGAAIAVALAREGFDVAVSSTRPEKLSAVLAEIGAARAHTLPVALDVRSHVSIERAVNEVLGAFGRLDVLVNNAGIALKKPALEITPEEWDTVIATDLTGAFFLSQAVARQLIGSGRGGSIINIASTHGVVGVEARAAYGVAKAGLIHLTRMLAVEWAPHRIRVNAVAPGRVETPSRSASLSEPGYRDWALARVPLRRFATPEEVAAAVCFLAGPQADYITGQTLVLDGGLTAA